MSAFSVMTDMNESDAASRSADPQYPANAGSNMSPSQCTITFPETFERIRAYALE